MEVTTQKTEDVISAYLRRTNEGLRVDVKVHPDVEAFFRTHGQGQSEAVRVFGKFWSPLPASQEGGAVEPLRVWVLDWPAAKEDYINPGSLHAVSGLPRLENGRVNMSFLRLVGASRPEGVSFIWNVVLGEEELRKLAAQLHRAQERFYQEFVKPTEIEVAVERRLPSL